MASRKNTTTIQLEIPTRERLMEIGRKGQTYDDVLNMLLDHWAKKKKK